MQRVGVGIGLQPNDLNVEGYQTGCAQRGRDITAGVGVPVLSWRYPETHRVIARCGCDMHHVGGRGNGGVALVNP